MNIGRVVKPMSFSEGLVFMSPFLVSDPSQPLPQLTPQDSRFGSSLLKCIYIELHCEKPATKFIQTVFHKLSHTIEGLFMDKHIQSICSKKPEKLREKKMGTMQKATDQRYLKINAFVI